MAFTEEQIKLFEKFERDVEKRSRIERLLLVMDQFFSVLIWNSSQDETISSRIYRKQVAGTANWFDNKICCLLKLLEAEHCLKSLGE